MTPRPEEHVRTLLGAYSLGHLAPDEDASVRAHLEGCPACREEAASLEAVADLLPLVDQERFGAPEAPPEMLEAVLTRIDRERDAMDRRRQRSFIARVAAVAAALVVVVGLVFAAITFGSSDPASGEAVAMTATVPGVSGEAIIHDDPRSTWVELNTSGLSEGETYAVWLEEVSTGERSPLGSFTGVEGDLYISLYSTLPRDRAASIGVSTPDGSTLMRGTISNGVAGT